MSRNDRTAQEVMWAFNSKFDWIEDGVPGSQHQALAAAFRAMASRILPEEPQIVQGEAQVLDSNYVITRRNQRQQIRAKVLEVSDALEALSDD